MSATLFVAYVKLNACEYRGMIVVRESLCVPLASTVLRSPPERNLEDESSFDANDDVSSNTTESVNCTATEIQMPVKFLMIAMIQLTRRQLYMLAVTVMVRAFLP